MATIKEFMEYAKGNEKAQKLIEEKVKDALTAAAKDCGFTFDANALSDDQLKAVAGAGARCVSVPHEWEKCVMVTW